MVIKVNSTVATYNIPVPSLVSKVTVASATVLVAGVVSVAHTRTDPSISVVLSMAGADTLREPACGEINFSQFGLKIMHALKIHYTPVLLLSMDMQWATNFFFGYSISLTCTVYTVHARYSIKYDHNFL